MFHFWSQCSCISRYHAVTSVDEDDNWYGGNLIYDQDENSEAYKHYAMLCQVTYFEL